MDWSNLSNLAGHFHAGTEPTRRRRQLRGLPAAVSLSPQLFA